MKAATNPIRVVVADASPTARADLTAVLEGDEEFEVVAEAVNGLHAVEVARLFRPDVVLMDAELRAIDGFAATRRIMAEQPTRVIVVSGRSDAHDARFTLQAARAGALTVVPKPSSPAGTPDHREQSRRLLALVKALADVKIVRQRGQASAIGLVRRRTASDPLKWRGLDAVGVAASTGGPPAVFRFLQQLPADLALPVFVVQHIAHGFIEDMTAWLAGASLLRVKVAQDGEALRAAHVYVAPDDRHLLVREGRVHLASAARSGGFRPSANVLFSSLAHTYGSQSAAVILSGMGHDGVDGARALRAAGGLVLAQDDTSVISGMPRAVVTAGLAHFVGPVDELAAQVVRSAVRPAIVA